MASSALQKGKGRALPEVTDHQTSEQVEEDAHSTSGSDSSDSESDESDTSSESDQEDEEISEEFLNSLLEQARRNASGKSQPTASTPSEEEVIHLEGLDDNTEYAE